MNGKVLIITNHYPDRSPGQRFSFEQYLNYLRSCGFEIDISFLLNEKDDKIFYSKGNYFGKAKIAFKSISRRLKDLRRASKYDIVYVFREAIFFGTPFFERQFAKKSNVIFALDDSIWVPNVSSANKIFSIFKNAAKTSSIIKVSDLVFAGNKYLANYASQFNKNVVIVPTTIDTDQYKPVGKSPADRICIGWSGSITTIEHFETKLDAFLKIKKKYADKIYFKVIGDGRYINNELGIKGLAWKKEDELKELNEIDIGIMPLPDSEWAKGKCGLKGLQYMALGIPTIMSPVGVNSEIITDGENGFLADSDEEWIAKLSLLIDSFELRKKLGDTGCKTVEEKYSVHANRDLYLKYFNQLLS